MKKFNDKSGFTLIEIIVVLIIVGILAAIALPNFFSNVNKSKAQEAFAAFEQYKVNLEICLNMHVNTESVCAVGGASAVALPTSTNMTYSQTNAPANTVSNLTGISAWAGTPIKALLRNGIASDSINLVRASNGTYSDTCSGAFNGVC